VLVDRKEGERGLQALHKAFDLDKANPSTAPAATGD
jgi:hypothetical protein